MRSGTGVPPVRARIFPKLTGRTPVPLPELTRLVRWFAPVAACGMLAVAVLRQEGAGRGQAPEARGVTLIASNRAAFGYEPAVNRSPEFFEWTNRSGSVLNVRSFLPGKTN